MCVSTVYSVLVNNNLNIPTDWKKNGLQKLFVVNKTVYRTGHFKKNLADVHILQREVIKIQCNFCIKAGIIFFFCHSIWTAPPHHLSASRLWLNSLNSGLPQIGISFLKKEPTYY